MSVIVSDTLTGTSGTNLTSHTPNIGTIPVSHPSYTNNVKLSGSDTAYTSNAAINCVYYQDTPATAEYTVRVTLKKLSAINNAMGVAARIDTSLNTMYFARYAQNVNQVQFLKVINGGTATSLGSAPATYNVGDTPVMDLECFDALKSVKMDGVTVITNTDNTITAAGKGGIRDGGAQISTPSTGWHWAAFSITDLSGGGLTKTVTETLSISDTITRSFGRVNSEIASITDSVVRTAGRVVSEAVVCSDSIKKSIGKVVFDILSIVDVRTLQAAKVLLQSVDISELFNSTTSSTKTSSVSDVIILTDAKNVLAGKNLSETINVVDSKKILFGKQLVESIQLLDIRTLTVAKTIGEMLGITDSASAQLSGLAALIVTSFSMLPEGATISVINGDLYIETGGIA